MNKSIAVTGATGFVGRRLVKYNEEKFDVKAISVRDIDVSTINLNGIDAVVHLAGKAHQMTPISDDVYFQVNYELTKKIAQHALHSGVKQFIYISSTKVYGDNVMEAVLNEQSPCTPTDAYGASKWEAEQFLQTLNQNSFKVAVIRPPLIYGSEVKGNMIRLLKLAAKKSPLPLGNINNARSMVFVDNLIELINTIVEKEASGVFIAGDREPISTSQLIKLMRQHVGNNQKLLAIPSFVKWFIKKIRPALYVRLFNSFVVDNCNTNKELGFQPPYTTSYGVEQMVKWYQKYYLS